MVEWVSSGSERTFDQSAANGRKEPNVPNAARCTNGRFAGRIWQNYADSPCQNLTGRSDTEL